MSATEFASGWPQVRLASVLGSRLISGGSKTTAANGGWRPTPATDPLETMATKGHQNPAVDRAGVGGPPPVDVRAGDFLVCRNAGTPDRLGQGVLVEDDTQLLSFPSTMTRVRVRPTLMHPAYLEQLWQSSHVREQIKAAARSGRTHSLTIKALLNIRFSLPPPLPSRNASWRRFGHGSNAWIVPKQPLAGPLRQSLRCRTPPIMH
ncbi:hypothetical protein [Streptomyces mirabilis]|uniref:Hedgehog/Intein (Hint) domain-containing protein n=1 Tax=Streptomyces mirabilis TaxID=68239 RepID=A0ABU3V1D9_9ACTN|nr:hypothetical protein [Streptomyces mirabilis]MDU9000001.1 hypothetical protein [Streptomyces mirabilis]